MQKFAGFDRRTQVVRWGLFVVALGILLGGTLPQAVDLVARALATQHASLPWYASRLLAFLAYLATAASVVYGLLLSTKLLDVVAHRPISFTLHQDLSAAAIGLTALHGAVLALDTFVPQSVRQLIIPFAGPYRPEWVGIGQITFYLMIVVYASFSVRRRIGQRAWRLLHYTTLLAFVGATAHGLMSGTDSPAAWAFWAYTLASVAVAFLLVYRITLSVANTARPAVRPGARATAPVAQEFQP